VHHVFYAGTPSHERTVGLCPSSYACLVSAISCKRFVLEGHDLAPGMSTLRADGAGAEAPTPWRALPEDQYDSACSTRKNLPSHRIDKKVVRLRYLDRPQRKQVSCLN
jgi:hypothetical protein